MSRDKSQGIVLSFYHAIHATRLVQMPLKKEEVLPFSFAATRRKKPKKSFSSDWAKNLAGSDKGSYFDQGQWLKKLNEQPPVGFHTII